MEIKINCAYDKLMDISELKENPKNPRAIDEPSLIALKKQIVEIGFFKPQIVNKDNMLLGGNQRLKALKELSLEGYDCSKVPISYFNNKNAERYVILADNNQNGQWNHDIDAGVTIGKFLEDCDIDMPDFDIDLTGFDLSDLAGMDMDFGKDDPTIDSDLQDEVPDISDTEVITRRGDLWEMGWHRLLCGDSTAITDVDKLMDGHTVDSLVTDPPYGVDYSNKNKFLNSMDKGNRVQKDIENDNIENYREWFASFLSIIPFSDYNTFYIWMSGKELHNLRLAIDDAGLYCADYLVWVKNNHVLGRKDYNSKHEFCVYGWKNHHKFYGDFSTTILEFNKPLKNDLHPTMKPVDLITKLVTDGTPRKGIVLDLFGGSGTTLIACEKTGRKARLMEIDQHYCDVIVNRYVKLTENKNIKLNGKPYTWEE